MKKLLPLLLFIAIGCQSTLKLDGIWEMDYRVNNHKVLFSHGTTLLDFMSDSVRFVQIGDTDSGAIDTVIIEKNLYQIKESTIRIIASNDTLELNFHSISIDSIAFSINDSQEISVARKLTPLNGERVNKSDLVNNGFEVLNGEYYHKLDFINDTIVFDGGYHSFSNWDIITYKKLDFLSTSDWFFPRIPLVKVDDKIIALINKGQDTIQFKPLIAKRKKSEMIGSWKEIERTPGPPLAFEYDTAQTLYITGDSIKIGRFDKIRNYVFELNSEGTVIHFANTPSPNEQYWNPRIPMEIIELTSDELTILERHRGDSTIIKYKKAGNML